MSFQPFPIVPFVRGLEEDKESFLLENDAFPEITDAYLYQGRIHRRIGNATIGMMANSYALTYVMPVVPGAITYTNTLVQIPVIFGIPGSVNIVLETTGPAAPPGDTIIYNFVDDGNGFLNTVPFVAGTSGTIAYGSGVFVINFPALAVLPANTDYNIYVRYNSTVFNSTGRLVEDVVALAIAGGLTAGRETTFTIPAASVGLGILPGSVTVNAALAPPVVFTDIINADGILLEATTNYTGTIDYITGVVTITHPTAAGAEVLTITFSHYTGRPVMGLFQRETDNLNREELIAFDTTKANAWDVTNRFRDISYSTAAAVIQWTSTNSEFFWGWNYYRDTTLNRLFWATNNKQNTLAGPIVQDGIQIYNGVGWALQTPQLSPAANRFLNGCLILISYRNRMVALNTLESAAAVGAVAVRYHNRARWSQNGVPYTQTLAGFVANAWDDTVVGLGGYNDAPTSESITSCQFYKDTLIVFFERSTWQLVYSGNAAVPFFWQRINSQYGCESTHSIVEFDKGIFAVGDTAIITSDSVNVERIDAKIPVEVFNIHNDNAGPARVHGIRDYFYQFVYWTWPDVYSSGAKFPNKLLVFNYLEGSYSFYNDSYTCLGYYRNSTDTNWLTMGGNWLTAPGNWASGYWQAGFPNVIAGNQAGYVMILDQKTINDPTLYITGITQAVNCVVICPDHNLQTGQYVIITGVQGMAQINNLVGKVGTVTANTIQLDIDTSGYGAWVRRGEITVINTINVMTKKFNPFFAQGKKVRSNYADFYVDDTSDGSFTLDFYVDDSTSSPIMTVILPTQKEYGPLVPNNKVWQRVYCDCLGQFIQLGISLSESEIRVPASVDNVPTSLTYRKIVSPVQTDIVIHVLNLWMAPSGRLQSYDIGGP